MSFAAFLARDPSIAAAFECKTHQQMVVVWIGATGKLDLACTLLTQRFARLAFLADLVQVAEQEFLSDDHRGQDDQGERRRVGMRRAYLLDALDGEEEGRRGRCEQRGDQTGRQPAER